MSTKISCASVSLCLLAISGAAPASAQDVDVYAAMRHPAVKAAMSVCRADRDRLCASVWPGSGRIVRCLASKSSQLSPDCRSGLENARDALVAAGIVEIEAAKVR